MRSTMRTAVMFTIVIGAAAACSADTPNSSPTTSTAAATTTAAPTTTVAPTTTAAPTTTSAPTTTVAPTTTTPDPSNDRVLDAAESKALSALLATRQAAGEPGASDAFELFTEGSEARFDMVDEVCGYLIDFPFNGLVSAIASLGWSKEGTEMYVTEIARVSCRDLLPEARR